MPTGDTGSVERLACGVMQKNVSEPFRSAFTNANEKLAEKEKEKIYFLVVRLNDSASHQTVHLSATYRTLLKGWGWGAALGVLNKTPRQDKAKEIPFFTKLTKEREGKTGGGGERLEGGSS